MPRIGLRGRFYPAPIGVEENLAKTNPKSKLLDNLCNAQGKEETPRLLETVREIHSDEAEDPIDAGPRFRIPTIGRRAKRRRCFAPRLCDRSIRDQLDAVLVEKGNVENEKRSAPEVMFQREEDETIARKFLEIRREAHQMDQRRRSETQS